MEKCSELSAVTERYGRPGVAHGLPAHPPAREGIGIFSQREQGSREASWCLRDSFSDFENLKKIPLGLSAPFPSPREKAEERLRHGEGIFEKVGK